MEASLAQLEGFGELDQVAARLSEPVRAQLVVMSPATIDRMLRPTKAARYPAAKSATGPSATLRSSIGVRQAMDGMEKAPGFFEIDLVAHCGHSLKGEHAWTLTATDVYTGWTENIAIRNRAHTRVVAAIEEVADRLPYPMLGLDCDNGGEFINHALIGWCAERAIFMTRARAHTSNDNAHVEQKNGDIVRRSAFRYRYDTGRGTRPAGRAVGAGQPAQEPVPAHKEGQRLAHHQGRTQHPHLRPAQDPLPAAARRSRLPHPVGPAPAPDPAREDQPRRADPEHQPDPTSPHRLSQGQNPRPAGAGFVSKIGEAHAPRFASILT